MITCKRCQSPQIIIGKELYQNAEIGKIGIPYKKGFFRAVEPLLVDLCKECGEVQRIYVQNGKQNWY